MKINKSINQISFLSLAFIILSSCKDIEKQLDIAANRDLEAEMQEIVDKKAMPTAAELERKKVQDELKMQAKRDLEVAQEKLIQEKAQKELEAAKLEEEALQQKLKEEKEEEEKIAAQIAEIKRKQALQKEAWGQFIGTEYEEIEVAEGKVLKKAKATEVRATHVTFVHSAGIANVKFKDLSGTIRRKCRYDPELAELAKEKSIELQKRIQARLREGQKSESAVSKNTTSVKSSRPSGNKITSTNGSNKRTTEKAVRPSGSLKVRVVGVDTDGIKDHYYRGKSRRDGTKKIIEIKAYANVDATVEVVGVSQFSISAKQGVKKEVKLSGSKYTVILKDKKGNVLSTQKHNHKSGL